MIVSDSKILIRPLEESDLSLFYANFTKAKLRGEMIDCDIDSEFTFRKEFQKNGFWQEEEGSALILDGNSRQFGAIKFKKSRFDVIDLCFLVFEKKESSSALMSYAVSLFSSHLFSYMQSHRQQILLPNYDRFGIRISQSAGFMFEGILREAVFHKGHFVDLCIYSMLRDECKSIEKLY